ncbi:MAG: hypothetical protein ACM3N4_04525 [Nitrososphaerota archaeon]
MVGYLVFQETSRSNGKLQGCGLTQAGPIRSCIAPGLAALATSASQE